jgi:hypothetical protein
MEKDLSVPQSIRQKWKSGPITYKDMVVDIPCTCKLDKPGALKVLPTMDDFEILVWNDCTRCLFASAKRHCAAVPLPDPIVIIDFMKFAQSQIDRDLGLALHDFDYSYSQWFNHLTQRQQQELVNVNLRDIENKAPSYVLFPKREIQAVERPNLNYLGSAIPKTRAISGPMPEDKAVLGPVTWALEQLCALHVKGYCGNKNWEEQEAFIRQAHADGYTHTIQGDFSGLDRTQSHELKGIDRYIYGLINDKIHHVDPEVFSTKATSRYRKLKANFTLFGKIQTLINITLDATTATGNSDTTLLNTLRVLYALKYVMLKSGYTDDDYLLLVKGDDFVIFIRAFDPNIEPTFYQYFSKKDVDYNKVYGLGMTLKFLKFGGLQDFDFCSTNLIVEGEGSKFRCKLVRQTNRMYPLLHWSMKALAFSHEERSNYMRDIACSIDAWAIDMPFFSDYSALIKELYPTYYSLKVKTGKDKLIMPTDGHATFIMAQESVVRTHYGHDFDYGRHTRQSKNTVSKQAVIDFLFQEKLMSESDIQMHFDTIRFRSREGIGCALRK